MSANIPEELYCRASEIAAAEKISVDDLFASAFEGPVTDHRCHRVSSNRPTSEGWVKLGRKEVFPPNPLKAFVLCNRSNFYWSTYGLLSVDRKPRKTDRCFHHKSRQVDRILHRRSVENQDLRKFWATADLSTCASLRSK